MNLQQDAGIFPGGRRYNAMGAYFRERFGCTVRKVSVDAGFTCPNRDGTVGIAGCIYCNNDSFRPAGADRLTPIAEQVEHGIARLRNRFHARKFIVYFQPFTNTHGPLGRLVPLYESALEHPDVVGLSVGTRPDCIDEGKLRWFEALAREKFVMLEYGLESVYDETLVRINRGHDYRCWREAVSRTRGRGIWLGAHIILGFPWETRDQILSMATELSAAGLDSLKLHHLHVVRNTAMAQDYARNPFKLLGFEEYVDLVVDFLERLNSGIRIERLFGEAPPDSLLGPDWSRSKAEIQRGIEQELEERGTYQGRLWIND